MSSSNEQPVVPNWDVEQYEAILDAPGNWQLVIAGPGAGKSAVACQRVAYLLDEAISPSRMLLLSFTRTAVAELRDRIISYSVARDRARNVRIATIDSHAWALRTGFDDEPLAQSLFDRSYELAIQRTLELFTTKNPNLLEFLQRLEHLIIDEAQDVMGVRADLILEMLRCLAPTCGVTILADPAQAIYGFTTDDAIGNSGELSLLDRLPAESPRPLLVRKLENIHRVKNAELIDVFVRTRKQVELADRARDHVADVQKTIRETCGNDFGATSFENLAEFLGRLDDHSPLVLFRNRADVLFASSFCSKAGIEHRLRMSDLPIVVRPWLGWLLGETVQAILSHDDYDKLWDARAALASEPFVGETRADCWALLHRLAAGTRQNTLDLVHLRNVVARSRPPVELCYSELGSTGPVLGTIHASKGREADMVILVMPQSVRANGRAENSAAVFEEGRVYYVGATRARKMLVTAGKSAARVGYLDSKRVYHFCGERKVQLEVGRDGDVDKIAHLAWSSPETTQHALASTVGRTVSAKAWSDPQDRYASRIFVEQKGADGITRPVNLGQLSNSFQSDLGKLWHVMDADGRLKPAETIPHLYVVAIGTVGIAEDQRNAVKPPFRQSAIALAPVVKGFPLISFLPRRGKFLQ